MRIIDLRKAAVAAVVGGICWAFGVTAAVLGELDYRGLTDNPIPDALGIAVTSVGTVLLMISFVGIRHWHRARGATAGAPGYWIVIAGLVLALFPIWPLFVLGPMVLGVGATIYAGATLASGKVRSFGLWLHALCIPVGIAVGFAFAWGGYDGGIGIITFMVMLLGGFMTLAYDATGDHPVASLAPERVEVTG